MVWPTMQDALALEGLDGIVPYPVTNEPDLGATARTYTGVVVQYEGDGVYDPHAIYSQLDAVKYQYGCFLSTFLEDGNGDGARARAARHALQWNVVVGQFSLSIRPTILCTPSARDTMRSAYVSTSPTARRTTAAAAVASNLVAAKGDAACLDDVLVRGLEAGRRPGAKRADDRRPVGRRARAR